MMQQNNGWFQLESQKYAGKSKEEPSEGRKLETRASEARGAEPNPNTYNLPKELSKLPGSQNVSERPTPKPEAAASFVPAKDLTPDKREDKANDGIGWTKQDYAMPVPPVPAEEPSWGNGNSRKSTELWNNDRILKTRHSQTVGERGPVLAQDSTLHEALEVFISGKILERPVHVKGYGAFGTFRTASSMSEYTKLSFLATPGQQVPVMVRFSLAAGNRGTPDTARGVKGFATKFYTPEGVFDLVFNHLPVLFVRDGLRFPQAFTSLFPSPVNNLIDPERFWRFVASAPESTHFVTWLYSDAGTVKSFRHIPGHSVNTFVWRNAEGARRYVKYHWIPVAGEEYITAQEGAALAGINPDYAGQELYDTLAAGTPIQYELRVQLMDPDDENRLPYDPLDCTKVWDERQYPLLPVGVMTLDRNPDNYMEQVEKAAFSPTNLLDGAELSDDKLLQARANIYWDSQRRRLGENFRSIPVNHQENWTPDDLVTSGVGTGAEGRLVRSEIDKPDDFTQAGERYESLSTEGEDHLVDNLAGDLKNVSYEVRKVVIGYFYRACAELGERVAEKVENYSGK